MTSGEILSRRNILIVEDDPLIALDLAQIVEMAGARVIGPTARVSEALDLMKMSRCDAAVLDVRLAAGDTLGLADELGRQGIPFLFQTSDPGVLKGQHDGAVVLTKPFRPEQLIQALTKLLAIGDEMD